SEPGADPTAASAPPGRPRPCDAPDLRLRRPDEPPPFAATPAPAAAASCAGPPGVTRTARTLATAAVLVLAAAYLAMLQVRAADREPPLVVVWTAGVVDATVRHPRSGRAGWGVRADVDALIAHIEGARGWRSTVRVRSDAEAFSLRVEDVRGRRVAIAEVPPGGLAALGPALTAAGEVALVVVASREAPSAVLAAVEGPVAVLPGAYGDGVPDGGEAAGADRVVGPWIDGRYRVGVLEVRLSDGAAPTATALTATAVDLPLRDAPADAATALGDAPPGLDHDTVHLGQSGLGRALLDRMLAATGADVALVNHLALRAGLSGRVDLLTLEKALPFQNEVVLQTFDSAQLAAILAQGAHDGTQYLLVATRSPLPDPLPARDWRVATIDYLANGGRGGWAAFTEGRARVRTRIRLDDLAIGLLVAPPAHGEGG
ncbi:MAG: 5'-nucleotidase C-terminal domain-containing protein, partial [Pseudomonadota bacterium]|nr:5'-nucleotidase C-terminal domain-containing protein [Pseudomonadota bacterium]